MSDAPKKTRNNETKDDADDKQNDESNEEEFDANITSSKTSERSVKLLAIGGYLFLMMSFIAFGTLLIVAAYKSDLNTPHLTNKVPNVYELALQFSSHLFLLAAAILSSTAGYSLLRSAGAAFKEIIPEKDADLIYELLRKNKTDALDNYIKLASLSGLVGACTKLGITGLPLATISLTVFFAILGLFPDNEAAKSGFFDLSKLTLGAFIGSFVQQAQIKFDGKSASGPKS